ncbi:MAG: methylmalonyl Co-A mutase-associated GTPase MeaB [Desulfofustis sp. PB-SRB1]|jgi:LAO/AO transport system kinase|nr:methylmalonyl Co-A mutase-associated GTPase MeaB [Desulfofustis sp. PB-SRB1]MBM1001014.1 methylmalonyl Co-A mutase-associated GTPase MeaB [Desulfofustis sp. PB-SRB1]HBH27702.1 methylmalonyl Co-A mutase-associated GTPase MeaB [Desulfofustis sp.]HBH30452.1 methylmalonyl Co-A mutase-associated GTPase MeaB [Desulfofustis sp.]
MHNQPDYYIQGVLAANRLMLSRTITLIESGLPAHQELAATIIERLLPHTGKAVRLGITGVPGAGKSTFIESFGTMLTDLGHRVAVLAIDPSSARSGGSVLGDKTRMQELSINDHAFIRPSPSGGTLGGVARKTRETMLACEAAGFDVIIIETVGVGQSETAVASMVDFFLVLMIAGAGDELQGIKKGILEVADTIVINKADGDNLMRAERARREYETALHILTPASANWTPRVLTCSALKKIGLSEIWETVADHHKALKTAGEFDAKRRKQAQDWMYFLLEEGLKSWFFSHPDIKDNLPRLRSAIHNQEISPTAAAGQLLSHLSR